MSNTQIATPHTTPTTAQEVRDLLREMALAGQLEEARRGPYGISDHEVGEVFLADERDRGFGWDKEGLRDLWWVRIPDGAFGPRAAEVPAEDWDNLLNEEAAASAQ